MPPELLARRQPDKQCLPANKVHTVPELEDGYVCADIERSSCSVQLTKLQEAVTVREAAAARLAEKVQSEAPKP